MGKIYLVYSGLCDECHLGEEIGAFVTLEMAKAKAKEIALEHIHETATAGAHGWKGAQAVDSKDGIDVISSDGTTYFYTVPIKEVEV